MKELRKRLVKFRDDRGWEKYHTPAELARAVAIEAGELNELFLWGQTPDRLRLMEEMADVFIFLLNLSIVTGIDLIAVAKAKVNLNEWKHPVGKQF